MADLKKYEIDAVVDTIAEKLKVSIDDIELEHHEEEKLSSLASGIEEYYRDKKLLELDAESLKKQIKDIGITKQLCHYFTPKASEILVNDIKRAKIPSIDRNLIQREVILSNKKDLQEIVEELVNKFG